MVKPISLAICLRRTNRGQSAIRGRGKPCMSFYPWIGVRGRSWPYRRPSHDFTEELGKRIIPVLQEIHYLVYVLKIVCFILENVAGISGNLLGGMFNRVEEFLKTFPRKYCIDQFNAEVNLKHFIAARFQKKL